MHLLEYKNFVRSQCANCVAVLQEGDGYGFVNAHSNLAGASEIQNGSVVEMINNLSSLNGKVNEVANLGAISFVYKLSPEVIVNKLISYLKIMKDSSYIFPDEETNITEYVEATKLTFCKNCSTVIAELYKLHKNLEILENKSSLLANITKTTDSIIENLKCEHTEANGVGESDPQDSFPLSDWEDPQVIENGCIIKTEIDAEVETQVANEKTKVPRRRIRYKNESLKLLYTKKLEEVGNKSICRYFCNECQNAFPSLNSVLMHVVTHNSDAYTVYRDIIKGPPYYCPKCEGKYTTHGSLKMHCLNVHSLLLAPQRIHPTSAQPIKCSECGFHFDNLRGLAIHQRNSHGGMTNISTHRFAKDRKIEDLRLTVSLKRLTSRDILEKTNKLKKESTVEYKTKTKAASAAITHCDLCSLSFTNERGLMKHKQFCLGSKSLVSKTSEAEPAEHSQDYDDLENISCEGSTTSTNPSLKNYNTRRRKPEFKAKEKHSDSEDSSVSMFQNSSVSEDEDSDDESNIKMGRKSFKCKAKRTDLETATVPRQRIRCQNLKLLYTRKLKEVGNKKIYRYYCNECQNVFVSITSVLKHVVTHDSDAFTVYHDIIKGPPYSCPKCEGKYMSNESLKMHCIIIHSLLLAPQRIQPTSAQPIKCSECRVNFDNVRGLAIHKRNTHGGMTNFSISSNNEAPSSVATEETISDVSKPRICNYNPDRFTCKECEQTFSSLYGLCRHKAIHNESEINTYEKEITGPPFQCPTCSKAYGSIAGLKVHVFIFHKMILKFHTKICKTSKTISKFYKCNLCKLSFTTSNGLINHTRRKHTSDTQVCRLCSEEFPNKAELSSHLISQHKQHFSNKKKITVGKNVMDMQESENVGELRQTAEPESSTEVEPFFCRHCSSRFKDGRGIFNHNRQAHHGIENYDCKNCEMSFDAIHNLLCHLSEQHRENYSSHAPDKYICNDCNVVYHTPKSIERHLSKTAHKSFTVICALCQETFTDIKNLKYHKATVHFDIKSALSSAAPKTGKKNIRVYCDFCDRKFSTPKEMKEHRKTHPEEEQIHRCKPCNKIFPNRGSLLSHNLYKHPTEDKVFQCEKCGLSCKNSRAFRKHSRNHSEVELGYRPICHVCGKSCKHTTALKKHLAIYHLNRERKQCTICGHFTRTKYNMTLHMRVHEKNGTVKPRKNKII